MGHSSGEVARAGVTLVELLVVISIIGMIFSMTGLALLSLRTSRASTWRGELRAARARALRTGRHAPSPAHALLTRPPVLILPAGRTAGAGVDTLTRAPTNVFPESR